MKELILAVLLSFPTPWGSTETPDDYRTRLLTMSEAIATEAAEMRLWRWGEIELAAAVATVWRFESALRRDVHSGATLGDKGKSRCAGQIQANGLVPPRDWVKLSGVDLVSTQR